MSELLAERFGPYFRHPDAKHDVLSLGDRAVACSNLRRAIEYLGLPGAEADGDPMLFDSALEQSVVDLQLKFHHRVHDGRVGPKTRKLIVSKLLSQYEPDIFLRLDRPEVYGRATAFVSYAWRDSAKVDKLVSWLRNHDVRVLMDRTSFMAGHKVSESIRKDIAQSDKVIAVFSKNSNTREWPQLERFVAEQLESQLGTPVLIYLRLDSTPLPTHDSTRLAIHAKSKPLKAVGHEILYALTGVGLDLEGAEHNENEPL